MEGPPRTGGGGDMGVRTLHQVDRAINQARWAITVENSGCPGEVVDMSNVPKI